MRTVSTSKFPARPPAEEAPGDYAHQEAVRLYEQTKAAGYGAIPPLPPSIANLAAPIMPRRPAAQPRSWSRLAAAFVLAAIGLALAGVGMVETVGYSMKVGGLVFGALAVSADLLSLVMPSAAAAFWRARAPAALLAVILWVIGSVVTVANLSGYIGGHDDMFRSSREVQALNRSVALERVTQLRAERAGIRESRPVTALRIAVRAAKRSAKPALAEALAVAERRDAIDAELGKPVALGNTTTADPSAEVLSQITGTTVSETTLRRVRLLAWLLLPLCGGGVLSLAVSLAGLRRRNIGLAGERT